MGSPPGDVKFGNCVKARQDVFEAVEFRAVEATCRRLMGDASLLESQLLHDVPAALVSVEVSDADRLCAKVAERVTNIAAFAASVAMPCPAYSGATQYPVS
jgi:hypothetical protein